MTKIFYFYFILFFGQYKSSLIYDQRQSQFISDLFFFFLIIIIHHILEHSSSTYNYNRRSYTTPDKITSECRWFFATQHVNNWSLILKLFFMYFFVRIFFGGLNRGEEERKLGSNPECCVVSQHSTWRYFTLVSPTPLNLWGQLFVLGYKMGRSLKIKIQSSLTGCRWGDQQIIACEAHTPDQEKNLTKKRKIKNSWPNNNNNNKKLR